jgi:hypothetical protein
MEIPIPLFDIPVFEGVEEVFVSFLCPADK